MKYPQLVSMPSAVSDWLEEQLEARGIDAVVYTRYILSLLHSDTVDVIYSDEDLHFSHLKKEVRRSGGSRKRFRRSADWWKYAQADAEKLKRTAAVECLMSASEQTFGIESLIDELCERLNGSDAHHADPPTKKSNPELQQFSPQESAKRYYAAFPPLDRNASASPAKLISLIPKWIPSPKKKPAVGINRKSHRRSFQERMNLNEQRYGPYRPVRDSDWAMYKKARAAEKLAVNESIDLNLFKGEVEEQEEEEEEEKAYEEKTYEDLPVDIKVLLDDAPLQRDYSVDMMNLANMRATAKTAFIPFGTDIAGSIWSNETKEPKDNGLFDTKYNVALLGSTEKTSSSDKYKLDWVADVYFNYGRDPYLYDKAIAKKSPIRKCRWSEDSGCFEEDASRLQSFLKLNHDLGGSAFAEYKRPASAFSLAPFSKIIGAELHREVPPKPLDSEKDKDDLLTSIRSHFRPINEKVDTHLHGEYADGATFAVTSNWEKINYRRTESGAMYADTDYGLMRKLREYRMKNGPKNDDFVLKYIVSKHDKSCQTEERAEAEQGAFVDDLITFEDSASSGRTSSCDEEKVTIPRECTSTTLATNTDNSLGDCLVPARTESVVSTESVWQQACEKCTGDMSLWTRTMSTNLEGLKNKEVEWQFGTLSKIWNGAEVCHCMARPPSTSQHSKLREDVSQDGDQLLSDLSSVQKSYMEESSLPLPQFYDFGELILPTDAFKPRRHSFVDNNTLTRTDDDHPWSFASRLEESCLIQMSTIPTLRSVTL